MAVLCIEHIGIRVHDMNASITFYQQVFGMEVNGRIDFPDAPVSLVFLGFPQSPEQIIELISGVVGEVPEEGRVNHLAFTVDDVRAEWERLKKLGIRFMKDEITRLPNGSEYIFLYGPSGEHLELFQRAPSALG